MASAFATQEVHFSDEGAFCENADSPGTNTYSKRIPVLSVDSGPPDQDRQADGSLQSRQNESRPGFLGPKGGGEFGFTTHLPGYGATTASGALAETWFQQLLSDGLGGSNVAEVGAACTAGSDATYFTYATGGTAVAHGAIRVGAKGDGRADGQFVVPGSIDAFRNVTLLTAMAGTPTNADTMFAAQVAYPIETVGVSKRFWHGRTDSGAQYHFLGCHLNSLKMNFPIGGLPTVNWGYRYAYWARSAIAMPTASSMEVCEVAPIAGGSVYLQTVGTATRSVISPSEINLSLDIGLAEQVGPAAGMGTYQYIHNFSRLRCIPTVSFLVPWSTTYDGSLYTADGTDTTHKHILVSLSCGNSTACGFYLPRCYPVGPVPAIENYNGMSYQRLTYRGREGAVTTSDLTRSAIRFFTA